MSRSQREPVSLYDTRLTPGTLKLASTTETEAILRSRRVEKVYKTTTWKPAIVRQPQKPVLKGFENDGH